MILSLKVQLFQELAADEFSSDLRRSHKLLHYASCSSFHIMQSIDVHIYIFFSGNYIDVLLYIFFSGYIDVLLYIFFQDILMYFYICSFMILTLL